MLGITRVPWPLCNEKRCVWNILGVGAYLEIGFKINTPTEESSSGGKDIMIK